MLFPLCKGIPTEIRSGRSEESTQGIMDKNATGIHISLFSGSCSISPSLLLRLLSDAVQFFFSFLKNIYRGTLCNRIYCIPDNFFNNSLLCETAVCICIVRELNSYSLSVAQAMTIPLICPKCHTL